jgi:DNA-binding transcriptional MerR regulator
MNLLPIGEVARRSGLSASALRYYEEKGLIRSSGRRGLHRLFGADVVERLALIALGQAAGFTLDEVARMFGSDGSIAIDRTLLSKKAEELERTIEKLSTMRSGLQHAAACRAPSHMECPTFRRILRAAAAGALAPDKRPRSRSGRAVRLA